MRQKHGQNFLTDLNIANNIIKAAGLTKEDEVLEIGPGKGVLTKLIQPQVKRLTAVEIDQILAQQLKYYFSFNNINNVEILNADFLKLQSENKDNAEKAANSHPGVIAVNPTFHFPLSTLPFKIISNLPYNVGTAIIQKILPFNNWTLCVLMLQKEVAHRLAAKQGTRDYGYISLFTQYYSGCELLFDVSPRCFTPQPKVVSSVIKLTNKHLPEPDKILFDFIKHAFSQRRKTILNSLSSFTNLDKSKASEILNSCSLDPLLRPDKLSLADFLNLTSKISL